MTKVLVLYYSAYGHIEAMANAVAEGARGAGEEVDIKRVPELVPEEIARRAHYKFDQAAPVATVEDPITTPSLWAPARGSAVSTRRWPTSLIRQAGFGCVAPCTARSAAPSPRPQPSMAARRPPSSRSSPTCCTSEW